MKSKVIRNPIVEIHISCEKDNYYVTFTRQASGGLTEGRTYNFSSTGKHPTYLAYIMNYSWRVKSVYSHLYMYPTFTIKLKTRAGSR